MKVDRGIQIFTGQVKVSRLISSGPECSQWRTGRIVFEQREDDWKLDVHLDVKTDSPALTLFVSYHQCISTLLCTWTLKICTTMLNMQMLRLWKRNLWQFSCFCSKHRLCIPMRRFYEYNLKQMGHCIGSNFNIHIWA